MSDLHIILAGQSNALGYENTGPAPYTPTARVQIWTDTNGDGVGDAWNYMLPGSNTGLPANPTVWGPEVQFANRWLSANPTGTLWIVKSTKGSTGLFETGDGATTLDWSPESTGEMFDKTTATVTAAKANLAATPYAFSSYDGVLWMQGEQDATSLDAANAYLANLKDFITKSRDAWDYDRIVIGRISDSPVLEYNQIIRIAQWQEFLDDPQAPSFSTVGFPRQPSDDLHYTADGHIMLGNAFYYTFFGE